MARTHRRRAFVLNRSVILLIAITGSLRSEAAEHWNTCLKYDTKTRFPLSRKKFSTGTMVGVGLLFHGYREPGPDGEKVLEMESNETCTTMYRYLMPLNCTQTEG